MYVAPLSATQRKGGGAKSTESTKARRIDLTKWNVEADRRERCQAKTRSIVAPGEIRSRETIRERWGDGTRARLRHVDKIHTGESRELRRELRTRPKPWPASRKIPAAASRQRDAFSLRYWPSGWIRRDAMGYERPLVRISLSECRSCLPSNDQFYKIDVPLS